MVTGSGRLDLYRIGGESEARRWSREYRGRLVPEYVASLERIQDLGHLELMMMCLPDLVGSPLSLNALREVLQVSHKAVSAWLAVLERLYAVFLLFINPALADDVIADMVEESLPVVITGR